jgi:predicted membrane-bound spermidine synthase
VRRYFVFFFVSGFCSVLYELVWLRLAMAEFGVTTALVSIVLSMFMAGLGLGSWLAGELLRTYGDRINFPALRLYALTELLVGISALLVPHQLEWGRAALERVTLSSSQGYYVASGLWIACTLVPWCACMGATIPIAMLAIRRSFPSESPRSFSYLYVANVLGAVVGAGLPLLLIEFFGFHRTLKIGTVCNFLLAASAMAMTVGRPAERMEATAVLNGYAFRPPAQTSGTRALPVLLFLTGLTSMGMEVVWIRQFTPYLGTVVYAFALILALYLSATMIGARIYRKWSAEKDDEGKLVWIVLGIAALLPLVTANPDIRVPKDLRVILGIAPFTGLLGFLTPMLVDRWSGGDPGRAGAAYAVNVVGCILGPLVAGFLLLPHVSERWVLLVLALPWLVLGAYPSLTGAEKRTVAFSLQGASYLVVPLASLLVIAGKGFEERFPKGRVLRDSTATIIATGRGRFKQLLVNGVGITGLTPITKMMAHLPLTLLDRPPKNALVVCFGMGTTYRSLMSWGIPVNAVELVPSVPRVFSYYHADAEELLHSPLSHVVIDDGRRYLERSSEQYDVITIDPPPPVEAAGSSLLYSEEFYTVVKRRLRPGGMFQQWLPHGEPVVVASVAKALRNSFPYVRVYRSVEGWGAHFLASNRPIPEHKPAELLNRMAPKAINDLMEWGPAADPEQQFAVVLNAELPIEQLIAVAPQAPPMRDDRPMNEYYVLRRGLVPARWKPLVWKER